MAINNIYNIDKDTIVPKVFITGVLVNGNTDSLAILSEKPVRYGYRQNFLTFEYVTVSYKYESPTRYQYMLEGASKSWSSFTESRNISFSNLSPGRYKFIVRSKNANGLVSAVPASFAFIIVPPFYKTWWFMLLVTIIVLSGIYLLYQYRIKQILKVERLRTRIASDLHDDVGSTLSSISILSEILSAQLDSNPKSAEMISKIGLNARNMLESMDDIIWAVNPANDKFQNLGLRIREYAIPLFESKNIKFRIHSADALALLHLTMDIRRNVYLIAKEAINNLVKYSDCEEVTIEFTENHSDLIMTVSDNGKGFDPESPSSRNGLKNMKHRADQIKAEIEIISGVGKGCTIKLWVKII